DARRGARGLAHTVLAEVLGIGVARGVAADHADADALQHAAAGALHRLLLEQQARRLAVLEVQVGVIAALAERARQQIFHHGRVDAEARGEERRRLLRRLGPRRAIAGDTGRGAGTH